MPACGGLTNAREKGTRRHATTPPVLAAGMPRRLCWRTAALPFPCRFPGPVRLLCGRLPHRAPLVLPARPRADKTTLLLSRHRQTHSAWWGRSPRHPIARPNRDLCFLAGDNEHRPVRTTNSYLSCSSRLTHAVVDIDRAVVASHTHIRLYLFITFILVFLHCLNEHFE